MYLAFLQNRPTQNTWLWKLLSPSTVHLLPIIAPPHHATVSVAAPRALAWEYVGVYLASAVSLDMYVSIHPKR